MSAYIAARHDEFGVALICRILRSATPGILIACDYRAARTRPPSDRKIRGEQLIADVREVDRQTTVTDLGATRRADLVNRAFKAPASTRLWGADITSVRTWKGFCYTKFMTDACAKKVAGSAVSARIGTEDLPLQAFNCAVWQSNTDPPEWIHHSATDRSTYRWHIPTDLPNFGIVPSVGYSQRQRADPGPRNRRGTGT